MSRAKVERLLNLTIALMATSRPLPAEEIGRLVEGYFPSDHVGGGDSFRRMFERDKEELRELGIPVNTSETGDGLVGYQIPRRDYALPDLALEPGEAAALGLAARFWSSATMASAGVSALRKLAATGMEPAPPPSGLSGQVDATEPAFPPLLAAARERRAVRFGYRRPGQPNSTERHLQAWGLVSRLGRWYVVGFDLDRRAARVFRLSRVHGAVRPEGPPGAFSRPPGVDLRALVAARDPAAPVRHSRLQLAPGAGHALRRDALRPDPLRAAGSPDASAAADVLEVPFDDIDRFADRLVGFGPDVVVLDPPDLRGAVVRRLQSVLR